MDSLFKEKANIMLMKVFDSTMGTDIQALRDSELDNRAVNPFSLKSPDLESAVGKDIS